MMYPKSSLLITLWEVNVLKISAIRTRYQCQKRWISVPCTENQCRTVALMGSFLLLIISAIGTTFQCSLALISIDIDTDCDTDFH